jgi:hypothetical protein
MSRPQRIDDHGTPFGGKEAGSQFPAGPHKVKMERSAEGAGKMGEYDQTTDDIYRDQEAGIRKAEGRKMKPGYRN